MSIDASAVARVTGIETKYQDLRGGQILYLPQRIALIAQGSTDASYSSSKFSALSAGDVGTKAGFGSPAHLAMLELKPANGDGIDSIPVDVFLLQQLGGSTAATGDITPVGTQTKAASYRVNIGGVRSAPFVIPVSASVSHIVGAIFAAVLGVLEMPVTPTPAYGAVTAASTAGNIGNGAATALTVAGTPRPGVYKLTATAPTVFRLTDPDGLVVSSAVTPTGATQTVGGIAFTLTAGGTPFAAGDSISLTVAATKLNLVTKWKGESANNTKIALEGDTFGVTFAFTQPTGGAGNPSVSGALQQFGDTWYTMVLNALNSTDATALDALASHGEGRWGDLVHKPYVSFLGTHRADAVDCISVTGTRRTDRVNSLLPNPGSNDLPFVSAARGLARVAKLANNNPACDYGGQRLTGRTPGPDASQWDWPTRDLAVKNGCSTIEIKDGTVTLSDVVTMYRPTGEEPPAYRYVCDIVKLQQVIFNLALTFEGEGWNGAPLIPDDQAVANPAARKPKDAVAAANAILDSLGLAAIIADPKAAKKKTRASISSQNPKRLDLFVTVQLAGNTNVKSVTLGFGFYVAAPMAA